MVTGTEAWNSQCAKKHGNQEISMVVQWRRLHDPSAEGLGSGSGNWIPHAATQSSQAATKDLACHN